MLPTDSDATQQDSQQAGSPAPASGPSASGGEPDGAQVGRATLDLTGSAADDQDGGGDHVVIEIDATAATAATSATSAPAETPATPSGGGRPAGAVDGRHARSERSRQAMVEALLDLLREGNIRPSSAQIAERAGVTQRTLFNQFGDMDSLVAAVAASQVRRVLAMLPDAGIGTLEQRAAAYSEGLATLLEETMHVRWAVVTNPATAETGTRAVQTAREFMRAHMAQAFAPELEPLDGATQSQVLDALEPLSDPAAWRLRRVQQGLSVEAAALAVHRTLLAVIRDAQR